MVAPVIIAAGIGAGAGLIGGAMDNRNARKNAKLLAEQRRQAQQYIDSAVKQGRGDLFRGYRQAQQNRRIGLEAGIGLINETLPQQMDMYRQGNMAAQNQLIQGLPAQNAAILGQPYDYNPQAVGLQAPPVNFQPQPFLQYDDLTYYQAFPPANSPFNSDGTPRQGLQAGPEMIEGYR